jgi:hypothetical protein
MRDRSPEASAPRELSIHVDRTAVSGQSRKRIHDIRIEFESELHLAINAP